MVEDEVLWQLIEDGVEFELKRSAAADAADKRISTQWPTDFLKSAREFERFGPFVGATDAAEGSIGTQSNRKIRIN
jgi:hypothetical protein